ncbi:UNKNOWN [Stylonychia lemnae]|uniref:Right handed beta helix domain-containing protein n=1 Tax=Stylonychia lemnae TaxID=5949 RepID=A0A078A7F1_STYLE|nr:UNKNOWN [Stylonychia lemnae]|eukprot:CDW78174.1 UNKNOWN [Stylonychia lemnae]
MNKTFARNYGGAIYIDSKNSDIQIDGLVQNQSSALNMMGGVIHLENAKSINVSNSDFSQYHSPSGSCISSVGFNTQIIISDSKFQEHVEFQFPNKTQLLNSTSIGTYGVIYITDAANVAFSQNAFLNNYQKKYGGVVYIRNSSFQDFGSNYTRSIAVYGGAIYLEEKSHIELKNITIEYSTDISGPPNMEQFITKVITKMNLILSFFISR